MPARRPRTPLTRDRVIEAAVGLADEKGHAGVTMRALGHRLGVEAMSLYHHVGKRDDVLDGMVDAVLAEVGLPTPDAPWREAMRERAVATRATLQRHPWAIGLLDSRRAPGPATLGHHDAVLGVLRSAGFSAPMAVRAFAVIDSFLYGFVLQEVNLPFDDQPGMEEVAGSIAAQMPPEAYPHLREVMGALGSWDQDEEFAAGLTLVLDALQPDAA